MVKKHLFLKYTQTTNIRLIKGDPMGFSFFIERKENRMHSRSAVILVENNKVALIKRRKNGRTYYTFPGGKVESDETIEEAAVREAYEELGVHVRIGECVLALPYNGTQYYFTATKEHGVFGTGQGEEFQHQNAHNSYEAVWLSLCEIASIDLIPLEMKPWLARLI